MPTKEAQSGWKRLRSFVEDEAYEPKLSRKRLRLVLLLAAIAVTCGIGAVVEHRTSTYITTMWIVGILLAFAGILLVLASNKKPTQPNGE